MLRRWPLVLAVLLVAGVAEPQVLLTARIVVDTTADTNARDSIVSLREAMLLATGGLSTASLTPAERSNVTGGPGVLSADRIVFDLGVFPPGAPATIVLDSLLPELVTGRDGIDATDAGVRIDGSRLSGTFDDGIVIKSDANVVRGLEIGGFSRAGIRVNSGRGNVVGGSAPGAGNVLVDNALHGVVAAVGSRENVIVGNYVGTDPASSPGRGGESGVTVVGDDGTIEGNVIAGNGTGIFLNASRNVVRGNLIGTDVTGRRALGNVLGVLVGREGHQIGGPEVEDRNVISGNDVGMTVRGSGHRIQGNRIGTDVTGRAPLGNGDGIVLDGASGTLIGGAGPGEGNLLSSNGTGIRLGADAISNLVLGNLVGTDLDGVSALGNGTGILLVETSASNAIGEPGAGNRIAFNGGPGVALLGTGVGNAVSANAIHSNTGLGIDLGADGVTTNDQDDADVGPNGLRNFPTLATARLELEDVSESGTCDEGASVLTITGTHQGMPLETVAVELFASAACDPSGHGEGETPLGPARLLTMAADGSVDFSIVLQPTSLPGPFVTATATGSDGSTSEFSACIEVASVVVPLASCDDGNPCTADLCDPLTGCGAEPLDGAGIAGCDDGDPCNGAEECVAGACAAGGALDCDDGDLCTVNLCDAALGCAATPRLGFESVTCRLDTMDALLAAAPDVPARRARKLRRRIAAVRKRIDAAAGSERPRRTGRKLAAAERKLGRLVRTIARLRKRGKVDAALLDALGAAAADVTGRLGAIR